MNVMYVHVCLCIGWYACYCLGYAHKKYHLIGAQQLYPLRVTLMRKSTPFPFKWCMCFVRFFLTIFIFFLSFVLAFSLF